MEKNVDAVFYKFGYYILPEKYADLTALKNGVEIEARRLKEVRCMAPDFIYESIEDETLVVENVKLLFPVKVNLYTSEEYDKILLSQVRKVCPGCARFGDDSSLDGHHREISLGGVCYEREDGSNVSYAMRVWWFYDVLEDRLDELAQCIDKGDARKFDRICKQCARCISAPERFIGGIKDGKYCIFMKAGLEGNLSYALAAYTAKVGAQKNIGLSDAGWVVYPYIPAGIKAYKGKIKEESKLAALTPAENCPDRYEVKLYCKGTDEKKRRAALKDFLDYFTYKVGEDVFLNAVQSLEFTCEEGELLTAAQIAEKFLSSDRAADTFPPNVNIGWAECDGALPYRRSCDGITVCPEVSQIAAEASLANDFSFYGEIAYAYIFVPATEDGISEIMATVGEYLGGEDKLPEPVVYAEDFIPSFSVLGMFVCYSDEDIPYGIAFDCLVKDEKAFFRFMKILAPVLSFYGAKIVVVNDDGAMEYKSGFVIEPADGETAN